MEKRFIDAIVKKIEPEEGVFVATVSSGQKDRMGDILNPQGWVLTNYRKNPVILWAHNQFEPPVGRSDKIWVEDDELKIKGRWAPTPFAQELRKLVEGGFLNALSVGFTPLEEPQEGKSARRFNKQELLEISWVNVPALANALVAARKMQLPLLTKALEILDRQITIEKATEYACRLEDPGKYIRFRRRNCEGRHEGKCVDFIYGVLPDGGAEIQALRLRVAEGWTEAAARAYCREKEGIEFEVLGEEQLQKFCQKCEIEEIPILDIKKIRNSIAKMEEAISVLKEMLTPEKDTVPSEAKGRKTNPEKSKFEAELKILSMVDKALEILRHRIIKKIKLNEID